MAMVTDMAADGSARITIALRTGGLTGMADIMQDAIVIMEDRVTMTAITTVTITATAAAVLPHGLRRIFVREAPDGQRTATFTTTSAVLWHKTRVRARRDYTGQQQAHRM